MSVEISGQCGAAAFQSENVIKKTGEAFGTDFCLVQCLQGKIIRENFSLTGITCRNKMLCDKNCERTTRKVAQNHGQEASRARSAQSADGRVAVFDVAYFMGQHPRDGICACGLVQKSTHDHDLPTRGREGIDHLIIKDLDIKVILHLASLDEARLHFTQRSETCFVIAGEVSLCRARQKPLHLIDNGTAKLDLALTRHDMSKACGHSRQDHKDHREDSDNSHCELCNHPCTRAFVNVAAG